jgi:hypothetical protein
LSHTQPMDETDGPAAYRHGCEIPPDLTVGAAALLTAMVAAAATRDKTELDVLLTEIGQISRYWAYEIKFGGEMLH